MEAVTGGISARTSLLDNPENLNDWSASFELKGKALVRNAEPLFSLMTDFLLSPDFNDYQRIHTVLNQLKVSLENSVPHSGHTYAARTAAACLSSAARLREEWSGLSQVGLIRELAGRSVDEMEELVSIFRQIAAQLFHSSALKTAVTVEEEHFALFEAPLQKLVDQLPKHGAGPAVEPPEFCPQPQRQGFVWSLPVNYVTRVFRAVPFNHPDSAALTVLSKLLRSEFLHREIREKGERTAAWPVLTLNRACSACCPIAIRISSELCRSMSRRLSGLPLVTIPMVLSRRLSWRSSVILITLVPAGTGDRNCQYPPRDDS